MYLQPRKIPIRVGKKYIAVVTQDTAEKLDVRAADRVMLQQGKHKITAILDITDKREFKDHQIGLFSETWEKLCAHSRKKIHVHPAPKPESNTYIKEKLEGKVLNKKKIETIIRDVVNDDLSDIEMTYFVAGCFTNGLSDKETVNLTRAVAKYGDRMSFKTKIVMDKHCIGGVPGNRTTMIVIPIITACGYIMPKTSSRAITSPSGTADTMEVIANIKNDGKTLKKIAEKVGGFISWGGGVDLAAADDKLIRVRYPLKLDPQGMLLASILAKKFAVSANHVIIDIPWGSQGKVKTKRGALKLRSRFINIGKKLGMKMKVVLTNASQPIGNGIGPVLEVIDVMKVLRDEKDAPQDLKKKSLMLATELLFLTGKYASKNKAYETALEVLESKEAYKQMQRIIKAQGRKKMKKVGKNKYIYKAEKNGKVCSIKNKLIASIARVAGAPKSAGSGVYVHKKIGDKVKKGDPLFTVYAENKSRLAFVKKLELVDAYKINKCK